MCLYMKNACLSRLGLQEQLVAGASGCGFFKFLKAGLPNGYRHKQLHNVDLLQTVLVQSKGVTQEQTCSSE